MSKLRQTKQRVSVWIIIGSESGANRNLRGLKVSTECTGDCAVLCVVLLDALKGLVMGPFEELPGSHTRELIV
jgi:hypothetical protein